jgi:hypothetical protein
MPIAAGIASSSASMLPGLERAAPERARRERARSAQHAALHRARDML